MTTPFLKQSFGWGFILWLIGYVLGIVAYILVPAAYIGYVVTPIGVLITLLVLFKKIHGPNVAYYARIAVVWTLVAVVCDFLFLVILFKVGSIYYKFDVYLYYALTFALPIAVGFFKQRKII